MERTGNEEFPVPLHRFLPELAGTPDEIWTRWLQMQHGAENHTPTEWRGLIEQYRHLPAHPGP